MSSLDFTVIVPVYNAERYLRSALQSVLTQDHYSWECICVDDGSSDDSKKILDEYARLDRRFKIIHQRNQGVSVARNAALDRAEGTWLVFMDADDQLVPGILKFLKSVMQDSDFLKYQAINLHDGESPVSYSEEPNVERFDFSNRKQLLCAFEKLFGRMHAWDVCYRREAFLDVRFLPVTNDEDGHYGGECFLRSRKGAWTNVALYAYYQRASTASTTFTLRHLRSCITVLKSRSRSLQQWEHLEEVRPLLIRKVDEFSFFLLHLVMKIPRDVRSKAIREYMNFLKSYEVRIANSDRLSLLFYRILTSSFVVVYFAKYLPFWLRWKMCLLRDWLTEMF